MLLSKMTVRKNNSSKMTAIVLSNKMMVGKKNNSLARAAVVPNKNMTLDKNNSLTRTVMLSNKRITGKNSISLLNKIKLKRTELKQRLLFLGNALAASQDARLFKGRATKAPLLCLMMRARASVRGWNSCARVMIGQA